MIRREDFSEANKCIYQPRAIGKNNKRAQMFFKAHTQLSVRDLTEKQKKHCTKHNLGLTKELKKSTASLKIGCIARINMKISSENSIKNMQKKFRNQRRKNRNKK